MASPWLLERRLWSYEHLRSYQDAFPPSRSKMRAELGIEVSRPLLVVTVKLHHPRSCTSASVRSIRDPVSVLPRHPGTSNSLGKIETGSLIGRTLALVQLPVTTSRVGSLDWPATEKRIYDFLTWELPGERPKEVQIISTSTGVRQVVRFLRLRSIYTKPAWVYNSGSCHSIL